MANIKSAIKRIRTSKRDRLKNLSYKGKIKKAVKAAIASKKAEDIRTAIKWLDKAASKNVVHKNLASRKKSRLMRLISAK
ncbi:30S ribosomal protein S20 [Candidatus Saganbacteria bacterium]|nr:30S ribosomal protein S20 [Candidatus Saganbacteria bacterium]